MKTFITLLLSFLSLSLLAQNVTITFAGANKNRNYQVVNLDSTICLEAPKIKPYSEAMRKVIATILQLSLEDVSIKATTTEQMGFAGREEGLYAYATVLLMKRR